MDFQVEGFLIRICKPIQILGGILFYTLGAGISRYLGNPMDWGLFVLGQLWVTIFQIGFNFLFAYFYYPISKGDPKKIFIDDPNEDNPRFIRRDLLLSVAFTAFASIAVIGLLFYWRMELSAVVFLIMGLMIILMIIYTVPPFQGKRTGYGEIIQAMLFANLFPAVAFSLQYGEIHRLVAMSTFPITLLFIAYILVNQFQSYAKDLRKNENTLLMLIGWERGMVLHNFLILISFLLFGLAMLFGISHRVVLPVFLVLPLGIFQIWYINRIASGAKPNWHLLKATAISILGLTTYLLAFSYWIR